MRAIALAGGLLVLCAVAVGCGDDGDGNDDGGAGAGAGTGGMSGASGAGTGGRNMLPDPDGGAGTGGSGGDGSVGPDEGEEGFPCLTDADCGLAENGEQLSCVESGFQEFGVCARPCTGDPSCASDEVCLTLGGVDPRCTNLINEEFALCGIIETSDCAPEAGLVCLYLPQQPYGVCTTLCESGGDADGGAPNPVCDADQFCRGGIVDAMSDPRDGVCGMQAARGEECGIFLGMFCDDADICGPESLPVGDETRFVCLEDCTESPDVCDEGKTCTAYMRSFLCM
jgi:hypothetical protein